MITVHARKYGGKPHYSFPVRLVEETPDCMIVAGELGRICQHHTKGLTIPVQNRSVEFYWPGRLYTVAADYGADGAVFSYYCNVIMPATFSPDQVEWVDLDLDLIVRADLTWKVLDEDEFEEHTISFGYPPEVVAMARQGLAELIRMVEERIWPFDGGAERIAKGLARKGW